MQAVIHRIQVTSLPKTAFDDWIRWYQVVDDDLKAQLRQVATNRSYLLHLDYHPLNVMVERGNVSGVLDWANARPGDPRADVARTYTILVVEPHAPHEPFWYRLVRRILARAWLNGYQEIAGELDNTSVFFAWAGTIMPADLACGWIILICGGRNGICTRLGDGRSNGANEVSWGSTMPQPAGVRSDARVRGGKV